MNSIHDIDLSQADAGVLLIHLGGLGDMCLAESTFQALSLHFQGNLLAAGYMRFLELFREYFCRIESIESRKWLYLFSEVPPPVIWKRIVFIGKDRKGCLRKRWRQFSKEPLIFIDMYPGEEEKPDRGKQPGEGESGTLHVEEHQLRQLAEYGIEATRKEVVNKRTDRVILYPEAAFEKTKWDCRYFVELYDRLKEKGTPVVVIQQPGLHLDMVEKVFFEDLRDTKVFLEEGGGVFFSNDSGMAHLAGACGLFTITIFSDFSPGIWHPRGSNLALRLGAGDIDPVTMENTILKVMGDASSQPSSDNS
jgi:hypothetical protein